MKHLQGFRSEELCDAVVRQINLIADQPFYFMEVCGGHTMAIRKYGIPSLLPPNIRLLSGPGCPVCVTSRLFIDQAIYLALQPNTCLCTYGDLIRVPGSETSLERIRSEGYHIKVVFSSLQALQMAIDNPTMNIIFLAIGFETTAPATAAAIKKASQLHIKNFFVLNAHKLMPPAMEAIIEEGIPINGYICPGHVSAITGTSIYRNLVEKYHAACVVSGFEPLDLLQSLLMLITQITRNAPKVEIQYTRAVKAEGNPKAMALLQEVFEPVDDYWRGLGILKNSGLKPGYAYRHFDASEVFALPENTTAEPKKCLCGNVLKGINKPTDCSLFARTCTPENPVGSCMVSSEGACQTFYHYEPGNGQVLNTQGHDYIQGGKGQRPFDLRTSTFDKL